MEERYDLRFLYSLDGTKDKKAVVDFCMEKGLISKEYECPTCKFPMRLVTQKRVEAYTWRCRNRVEGEARHGVRRSIRLGSWFDGSSLCMSRMLLLTYMWLKKENCLTAAYELRLNKNTVTSWYSRCRNVCMYACYNEAELLGGPGKVVELDEYLFGIGKDQDKLVFGGVEHGSGKCFFDTVDEISNEGLFNVIQRFILPGSTIISNFWKEYGNFNEDVNQLIVKQNIQFKPRETGAQSSIMWNHLKRSFLGKRRTNDQFDSYVAEYMWRKNHKSNHHELFLSFVKAIVNLYPPKDKDDASRMKRIAISGPVNGDDENSSQPNPPQKRKKS